MNKFKRSALVLAMSGGFAALVGCGGGSDSAAPATNTVEPSAQDVTISGRAADGYLSNATVCADLNANGQCDAGEPNTTSGAGGQFSLDVPETKLDVELVVQAIANLTVDEDNNQAVPNGFTLRSPINREADKQFVSPITTMVSDELKKSASTTLEQAKKTVSERLTTTFDPVSDYVAAAKDSSDASVQLNAERLHRIAQVTTRVIAKIEANVTQTDLDQAGITKAEFLARVAQQVEQLVSVIVLDVDATLDEPTFDADTVVEKPEYTVTPPIEETPTTGGTPVESTEELANRVAQSVPATPFFMDLGVGTGFQAVQFSTATYLDFTESGTLPGQYYFYLLERTLQAGSGNSGTLVEAEWASKLILSTGRIQPQTFESDMANVYIYTNGQQAFKQIAESFVDITEVTATAGSLDGEIYGGFNSGEGVAITAEYAKIDLSQLGTVDTIPDLYPNIAAADLADVTDAAIFPDDSAAFIITEALADALFVTSWHGTQSGEISPDAFCSPNASIIDVQSCNVVYGNSTLEADSVPATTFDALTYPSDATNEGVNGIGSNIGFESGGTTYGMFLFGDKANGSGRIEILAYENEYNLNRVIKVGTWEVVNTPFEHIRLNLPDGLYFRAFLDTVGGEGYAFLHEFEGYVRAGRATPAGVELPVYFNRNPQTPLLNKTASMHVLDKLVQWDKLAENPGFTQVD